ncbi:MarR family transcriptional regulator [Cellulomonas sp. JH27-2]|uniref:MarR family winged helix-turn-helix transcriptional regulator n=1 Tax=Cellulomonas sp. JH27-2 TaxID=2774139 RepID=UPI00177AEE1F|nr:MarR family transcriptional regulator [Cellulomonas sp. JH27-2]MBD8059636.1 MarR family transcriptional regulator [Cellulomonas sp. JH27-2]
MTSNVDPVASVEEQIALLLRLADRNRRRSRRLEHTLERSAHLALRQLEAVGPLGINEIADHLRLDASTVTRQVLAMEAAGFVERSRDENDGRRAVITMTDAGREALAATRAARHSVYSDVLGTWSTDDQQHLADLLARLNDSLDTHTRATDAALA